MKSNKLVFLGFLILIALYTVECGNKYTKEANVKKKSEDVDFRTLEKPFRMHKLNLVWIKAQQRLTEPKLKSLYSDLMIQDKEELIYKRVKGDGGDKDGQQEAKLRKKLTNIMGSYGLRQHFEDHTPDKSDERSAYNNVVDDHINRSLFKDKKLNMLWTKAENSGFTSEELSALKEEFQHHQDKIDQYYDLLSEVDAGKTDQFKNAVNEEELEQFNEIPGREQREPGGDFLRTANLVRDHHRELRDGYDRLQRIAAKGPGSSEFVEPKVQGLWRMAAAANFTVDELASIKVELQHYESRLLKLRQLHADRALAAERTAKVAAGDKSDAWAEHEHVIKKHARKVEKMHDDLETRILAKHNEL